MAKDGMARKSIQQFIGCFYFSITCNNHLLQINKKKIGGFN